MDIRQNALLELLDILTRENVIALEQAQMIHIQQNVIRALIKKDKVAQPRYEPSPVEIVMASGAVAADGSALEEEKIVEIWAHATGVTYLRIDPLRLDQKLITETFSQNFAKTAK